jgi:hypothetical protein
MPSFAAAQPHGEIQALFSQVFFVTGSVALPGPLPLRFSRNMIIVREGERLVLVNSVRLGEAGLAALDQLGKVTDVMRLAGNHGMDDPFYADRYGAKVWAVRGQRYTSGFDTSIAATYFTQHAEMDETTPLPIAGARLHLIGSTPPEGFLVLPLEGGTAIAGDSLQNWERADAFFSWPARIVMRLMGFIKPANVGPAWLKERKPPGADLRALLELPFVNLLPAHGAPVLGNARKRYRAAIERAVAGMTG